jgi:signal transduction histidine kinase
MNGSPSAPGSLDAYWDAALAVSQALGDADACDLDEILDAIAESARAAAGVDAVAVVRASDQGRPWLATERGLPDTYMSFLRSLPFQADTVSGRVIAERRAIDISDTFDDAPLFAPARKQCARAGFRALLSVPLATVQADAPVGALNLYRRDVHDWTPEEIALAEGFARHAAAALALAVAGEERDRELEALRRLSGALRRESHEYANRLHALSGLLELEDTRRARSFVSELVALHHESVVAVVPRICEPALAGLVLVQMTMAGERGVRLELDQASHLDELPAHVSDAAAVTIVGNLLENAIDAAAAMDDPRRRRVVLRARVSDGEVRIAVRDWGRGIAAGDETDLVTPGYSRKPGHAGIGLALLNDRILDAGGALDIRRHAEGVTFEVRLPLAPPPCGRRA